MLTQSSIQQILMEGKEYRTFMECLFTQNYDACRQLIKSGIDLSRTYINAMDKSQTLLDILVIKKDTTELLEYIIQNVSLPKSLIQKTIQTILDYEDNMVYTPHLVTKITMLYDTLIGE